MNGTKLLSLDFYNNGYGVAIGDFQYAWATYDLFKEDTGWPFISVRMLSYEPLRNIYHIERIGGERSGEPWKDPETLWIEENFDRIAQAAKDRFERERPKLTLEHGRAVRFSYADGLVLRHSEEKLLGIPTSLTEEQFLQVLTYKQQLRNLTKTVDKNTEQDNVVWPLMPSFLSNPYNL